MKPIKLLALGASAALAITAINAPSAFAREGEEHEAKTVTKVPDSAEGILQEIHKHHGELAEVVKSKQLAEVHHHAFAIRDLANALAAKVAAEKKPRVEGSAKNIARLAEDLDKTGDANDQDGTETNLKKLDGVLMVLEKQAK